MEVIVIVVAALIGAGIIYCFVDAYLIEHTEAYTKSKKVGHQYRGSTTVTTVSAPQPVSKSKPVSKPNIDDAEVVTTPELVELLKKKRSE